jgi:hypothetical protein
MCRITIGHSGPDAVFAAALGAYDWKVRRVFLKNKPAGSAGEIHLILIYTLIPLFHTDMCITFK